VRDLGGLPVAGGGCVRPGRVFRADGLHRVTDTDVAQLRKLGITQVFDLRSPAELVRDGTGTFAGRVAEHLHVPIVQVSLSPFDPDIDWATIDLRDRYVAMLEEGGAAVLAIFTALAAEAAEPVVFHCSGGKDRTGVVAALLLRALGTPDEVIVDDYALSEVNIAPAVQAFLDRLEGTGLSDEAIAYLTSSPPERMWHTLGEIDRRWGSTKQYLAAIGIGDDLLNALKRNLIVATIR
jgi:protein-tyrosine phosphatase